MLLPSLKSQVQVLLPCLLKLAYNWRNNEELCFAALDCIGRICCTTSIVQMQSNLIQTLLKIMRETAESVRPTMQQIYSQLQQNNGVIQFFKNNLIGYKAFETLHYVAIQLDQQFNIFVPSINKIIVDFNYQSTILNVIITLNIRCTRVAKTVLISAVQNWKQYI